jgi:hypothetical protein
VTVIARGRRLEQLRAAVIVPLAIAGGTADRRGSGLSKRESLRMAGAMNEGFRLVRHLGNAVTSTPMSVLSRIPRRLLAAMSWILTRWTSSSERLRWCRPTNLAR